MLMGVIVALLVNATGTQYMSAGIVQSDGSVISATNDNQVYNALTWQEYTQHPYRGSCNIYEDYSLGGTCAVDAYDPDADTTLDGQTLGVPQLARGDTW